MFKRNYERLSFKRLMALAKREEDPCKKQEILGFAIYKLEAGDNLRDIKMLVRREWENLSPINRLNLRSVITKIVGNTEPVFKNLYSLTNDTCWLEEYPKDDFEYSLLIAQKLPCTGYGEFAYQECIRILESNPYYLKMPNLLSLYKMNGSANKFLWEKMTYLLDSQWDTWKGNLPEIANVTGRLPAVRIWMSTLTSVSDWTEFIAKCPPKWKRFGYREAGKFFIKLSKKKKLDL